MSGRRTLLRQAGVGLVEVMIALLLSLLTVGVIIQVLLGNHKTYLTGEAIARVQEDSRFAVNLLQQELRMVGYQGCLSKQGSTSPTPLTVVRRCPTTSPSICAAMTMSLRRCPRRCRPCLPLPSPNPNREPTCCWCRGRPAPGCRSLQQQRRPAVRAATLQQGQLLRYRQAGLQRPVRGDIVMVSDCQKARIFQITQTQVVGGGSEVNIGHPTTTNTPRAMLSAPGAAPAARSRSASVPARY